MNARRRKYRRWFLDRKTVVVSAVAVASFAVLTVLVHTGALTQIDLRVTRATQIFPSPALDGLSAMLNVVFSAELSVIIGVIASIYLRRRHFGIWSLAPLAFLPLGALELFLKLVIHQVAIPPELHRYTYYPLVSIQLAGSFPSGHAIRTTFFCLLAALTLGARRTALASVVAVLLVALIIVVDLTRVYLGQHWPSDVVGGTILGAAMAQVMARVVEERSQRMQGET